MSDVETVINTIAKLVKSEPWRRGQGQPLNALDPTWNIQRSLLCDGKITPKGDGWWQCTKCGYCGNHTYNGVHRPINSPLVYLMSSINGYLLAREKEGVGVDAALEQIFHITGVALRYAAASRSEDLESYVQRLIVL